MEPSSRVRVPQPAFLVMIISWLIPGYGFYVNGLKQRGVFFFLTLELTFLAGAMLHGSVLLPDFWPTEGDPTDGFNIVSILTFFTQMFNGFLALISLLPELAHGRFALLPYDETNAWADLGAFYLLVSGGMNYFVLTSTYDHFYSRKAGGVLAADEQRPVADHAEEKAA
jgi:hypothetical protein